MSNIGQTSLTRSSANTTIDNVPCDNDVTVASWVIIRSGVAVLALADDYNSSNVIGVVETKTPSNIVSIRFLGLTNSIFTGLDETKDYTLSDITPGGMDIIPPTAPNHIVLKLGQAFDSTRFVVNIGTRLQRS